METGSPSLREQGVRALQEGKIESAIGLLRRAVEASYDDVAALAFLGIAYSQKGFHAEAKEALRAAVRREPGSALYAFNLGVALERAGDLRAAAEAYRNTMRISPGHAQARGRLLGLAPQLRALEEKEKGQAPGARAYPAGTHGAAGTSAYSTGAYGAAGQDAWATRDRHVWAADTDRFSLSEALRDGARVLFTPLQFFGKQEGREGFGAPMAFWIAAWLLSTLIGIGAVAIAAGPALGQLGGMGAIIGLAALLVLGVAWVFMTGLLFAGAGVLHLIGQCMGARGGYGGTFRATTYALAPLFLAGMIGMLLRGPAAQQAAKVLSWIGMGYGAVLLGIGLQRIHRLHPGAAGTLAAVAVAGVVGLQTMTTSSVERFARVAQRGQSAPMAIVGRPAPALAMADLAGRQQSLNAYRGRILLINFFASW
jgi:hypothetical protein